MVRSPWPNPAEPPDTEPELETGNEAFLLCACHFRRATSSASSSAGGRSDRRRLKSGSSLSGPRLNDPRGCDALENEPERSRSSGAHHPGSDEAKDEKRDVRERGESRGETADDADAAVGEENRELPNGEDKRGGWSATLRRALMPGRLTLSPESCRDGGCC